MKWYQLATMAFLLVLLSCTEEDPLKHTSCTEQLSVEGDADLEDSLCTSEQCISYLSIWKALFMEKNGLTEAYMDTHIEITRSTIKSWAKGMSFRVGYRYTLDWATVESWDSFIVQITADDSSFQQLELPRNTFLTAAEVRIATENRAFSSSLSELGTATELAYASREGAFQDLLEASGVTTLCELGLQLDRNTGTLLLRALATYEGEENACIYGELDLLSGEKNIKDMPCVIN